MNIDDRMARYPHLIEVKTNVFNIPERIKEYDSTLFVVFNSISKKFEIHSTANKGATYCMTVPYDELDERIIHRIRRFDVYNRGDQIFRDMEREEEEAEKARERDRKNYMESAIKESHSLMKKAFFKA